MTRGKYAAKANGQRAEAAALTAAQLRIQLDSERLDHAAETAGLRARIGSLEGQLLREIRNLATEEVARVRAEARQELDAERADRRDTAVKIADYLSEQRVLAGLTQVQAGELSDLLGFDRAELLGTGNREGRRITRKKMRYADSLIRRGATVEDIQGGLGSPGAGARNKGNRTFTVGGEA